MSVKQLSEALSKAQGEARIVGKSGKNTFDRYDYAKLEDFIAVVQPIMAKHGLSLVPTDSAIEQLADRQTANGKTEHAVRIKMTLMLMHSSGEAISVVAFGEGQDRSDKAVYKAITGARKYALASVFNLATGDDPENDSHEPPPAQRPVAPRQPEPQPAPPQAKPMAAVAQAVSANVTKGEIAKKLKAWSGVNAEDVKAAAATVKRALGIDGEPDAAGLKRMSEFIDKAQQDGLVFTDWAKGVK